MGRGAAGKKAPVHTGPCRAEGCRREREDRVAPLGEREIEREEARGTGERGGVDPVGVGDGSGEQEEWRRRQVEREKGSRGGEAASRERERATAGSRGAGEGGGERG